MQFLTALECRDYVRKLNHSYNALAGESRVAGLSKSSVYYYTSRLKTAAHVSERLIGSFGKFTLCLVWAHDLVWGDRSNEDDPPADWRRYRRWRDALGGTHTLHEKPGHLFDAEERTKLAAVIEFAIYLGWDTLTLPRPARCAVHLSHDDRITVHSKARLTLSGLTVDLEKLGLDRKS